MVSLLVAGGATTFLACFLGGVVGFAYGLVALPSLLLIGLPFEQAVAINLIIAISTRIFTYFKRLRDINWARSLTLVGGSAPGAAIGLCVAQLFDNKTIHFAAGILIIIAASVLLIRHYSSKTTSPKRQTTLRNRIKDAFTGALGGILGATTSLNGIPPAILLTSTKTSARNMVAD